MARMRTVPGRVPKTIVARGLLLRAVSPLGGCLRVASRQRKTEDIPRAQRSSGSQRPAIRVAGRIGNGWTRYISWMLLLASISSSSPAQSVQGVAPTDIEAAYLYNFGKFVRFPALEQQAPPAFSICILGEDNFGPTLDSLIANESIQGHRIVARRLESPASAGDCQIIYIAQSEDARLARDLAALEKKPILTVSSIPDFLARGGMVQFLLQNNRVRFAVNLAATERTGLELSSELLKVAVRVESKPAREVKQ